MRISYIRVSTAGQNTARQEDIEADRVFTDKESGKDRNRPGLEEMLRFAREGDTVLVHSMDRLGRSTIDIHNIVSELTDNGVTVEFIKEKLILSKDSGPNAKLMLSVFAAIAEFERSIIRERQREGIAKAKARGVYKGRQPAMTADQIETARQRKDLGVPLSRIARDLGVARSTLYAALGGAGAYAGEETTA
ncbi:recombinase family protein [Branchiibius sp. NY16-3462-2]|uniref:recombinase family protein n=1 Tax=Branchiibius sp. NY16-3462-2 TaxID=1807500 RepID=UPI0007948C89|nr:recombinase family protein [Branchiibius sp. NY16-3462-2]KYH43233.1 transposase [Branchiibius sp. NY16-3462-2]